MKKWAILFANGKVTERETAIVKQTPFEFVVAADGGIVNADCFGFVPNAVIGDFDSLPADSQHRFPNTRFIHRPSQERCDLEKALIFCKSEGFSIITILGATGKRLDHTLSNLSILSRYDQNLTLRILTPEAEIFIVRKYLELDGVPGQKLSLVPVGTAAKVSTTGLKYSLSGETLAFGQRESASNEFSGRHCTISLTGGLLFVFRLYPEI